MPVQDRQLIQSLLDAMRRGADADARLGAVRRLFAQLNYDPARKPLSVQLPADIKKQMSGSPTVIATGAHDGSFLVIHVQLSSERLSRTVERAIVSALIKDHPYALFVFSNVDHSRWHLLNVKVARKEVSDDNRDAKLRRLFRRISVASEDRLRTATERVEKLDLAGINPELFGVSPLAIQEAHDDAFDVEAVTKQFFQEYKRVFDDAEDAITGIRGPDKRRLFTQRLFNRLMFIAFIQKKGWLKFAEMEENEYLEVLWRDYQSKKKGDSSFYTDRLAHLFFRGLNNPAAIDLLATNRGHSAPDSFLQRRIGDVPYLNGGLFEKSDDGTDEADAGIVIPDKAINAVLHELFARFNFTVTESTPIDVEVAVDPEMLGKVFEELVTGRHESGSYYTPKPIVSFMCCEALKGYLETKCPKEKPESIARFVDDHDASEVRDGETVLYALKTVKCCDPACGSGAYLLGMMHELLDLRQTLFKTDKKLDAVSVYQRKLEIIQTNVYGVDLDPFAVNIARLRLWLSLAIDFDGDAPPPLPNLDFKIESGDSLAAPDPSDAGQLQLQKPLVDEFLALKGKFFKAHSTEKKPLKARIDALRDTIRAWTHASGALSENAFDWQVEFAEVFIDGGFDVVLANPPYVRQELIKPQKAALKRVFPGIHAGAADLCCYFYGRAVQMLRPGGVLAFISSNKWMRAEYGQKLRTYLRRHTAPNTIVDFGHSPVFPSADTFPVVPILTRRQRPLAEDEYAAEVQTYMGCMLPREEYSTEMSVGRYVAEHALTIPVSMLKDEYWTLEDPRVQALLQRIRRTGTPLKEYCNGPLYRGPVSGLNEAFYIDGATRKALIAEDSRSAELIKPLVRGRDVDRWRPRRREAFIIFTRRGTDIAQYPAVKRHLARFRPSLEARAGEQAWYELQASPGDDFARVMFRPKIIYQEIQFHSWFSLETAGACINNKVFMLPTDDAVLLGVLSSSLMWWFLTRTMPHMKDEALCPAGFLMENVRVTTGDKATTREIGDTVKALLALADETHDLQDEFTAQVCATGGIAEPDDRIFGWLLQGPGGFGKRVAKLAGRKHFSPAVTSTLATQHARGRRRYVELLTRQLGLERKLSSLVADAYALTAEERVLLHTTRAIRDPLDVIAEKLAQASAAVNETMVAPVPT